MELICEVEYTSSSSGNHTLQRGGKITDVVLSVLSLPEIPAGKSFYSLDTL